jgi:hypothetical protein
LTVLICLATGNYNTWEQWDDDKEMPSMCVKCNDRKPDETYGGVDLCKICNDLDEDATSEEIQESERRMGA